MPMCKVCTTDVPAEKRFCTECGEPMTAKAETEAETEAEAAEPSFPDVPPPGSPELRFIPVEAVPASPAGGHSDSRGKRSEGVYNSFAFSDPEAEPPSYSRYAMMATEDYLGLMLLALIPGVNILVMVILALGSKKHNLKNYASASLIMILIGAVVSLVVFFIFTELFQSVFTQIKTYFA